MLRPQYVLSILEAEYMWPRLKRRLNSMVEQQAVPEKVPSRAMNGMWRNKPATPQVMYFNELCQIQIQEVSGF